MNRVTMLMAGLALSGATIAASVDQIEDDGVPVYVEHQYTAELDRTAAAWHLLPLDGADQTVAYDRTACAGSAELPAGVWYLRTDRAGRAWLVPPSTVNGRSVDLKPCGTALAGEVGVPSAVLDWLRVYSGAIHVRP
ncbi:MAG: hypothetical protein MUE46_08945 [Xanthomonadales bacterium]|nr:hypothetical protein [Xanthomonadales bacterium]